MLACVPVTHMEPYPWHLLVVVVVTVPIFLCICCISSHSVSHRSLFPYIYSTSKSAEEFIMSTLWAQELQQRPMQEQQVLAERIRHGMEILRYVCLIGMNSALRYEYWIQRMRCQYRCHHMQSSGCGTYFITGTPRWVTIIS